VAFFSPTCQPCREKMPVFVDYARAFPGGRERVLAVVVGDTRDATSFVAALHPVARAVVENPGGTVSSAFNVQAYPTVLMTAPNASGVPTVTDNHVDLSRPVVPTLKELDNSAVVEVK